MHHKLRPPILRVVVPCLLLLPVVATAQVPDGSGGAPPPQAAPAAPSAPRASAAMGGPDSTLGLRAPDDRSVTLEVLQRTVRKSRASAQYTLDEAGTLDAVLGQRRASDVLRAPAGVRRRIDAVFPQTAVHFWDSDRI